jgi:hypothetical protein
VFQRSSPLTPNRTEIIRAVSRNFLNLGVKPENLTTVSNMFNNYVLSFVADEERFKGFAADGAFDEIAGKLSREDKLFFTVPQDFDEQFDFGLRILFEGLERVKHTEPNLKQGT